MGNAANAQSEPNNDPSQGKSDQTGNGNAEPLVLSDPIQVSSTNPSLELSSTNPSLEPEFDMNIDDELDALLNGFNSDREKIQNAVNKIKPVKRAKRILSLDGGGVRGLIILVVLKKILEGVNQDREEAKKIKVKDLFDLVIGTSTGGIIAYAINQGKSIEEMIRLYESIAKEVFGSTWRIAGYTRVIFNSGYHSTSLLEEVIKTNMSLTLNDTPLVGVVTKKQQRVNHHIIIGNIQPKPADDNIYVVSNTISVIDALRATSAAPWYFASKQIYLDPKPKPPVMMIDGGIGHNNPIWLVYNMILQRWSDCDIILLSIGTGLGNLWNNKEEVPAKHFLLKFMQNDLVNLVTDSNADHELFEKHVIGAKKNYKYFRFNPLNSYNTDGVAHKTLGEVPLDEYDPTILNELKDSTEIYLEEPKNKKKIDELVCLLREELKEKT